MVEGQQEARSHRAIRMAAAGPGLTVGQTQSSHKFLERECGWLVEAQPAHGDSVAAWLACALRNSVGPASPSNLSVFSFRRLRRTAWGGGVRGNRVRCQLVQV